MRICVGDLEANGFLNDATHVWCGVFIDISTGQKWKFGPDEIPAMLEFMDTCGKLIFHNGIGYDFPLLEKLYGYTYRGEVIDTLIMSRLFNPKRMRPFTYRGRGGPHSIECWGYRVGRWKPDHTDWLNYSPEMLHRCDEDTEILLLVYNELLKEQQAHDWDGPLKMTTKLFQILQMQEAYGWKVDQEHLENSIYMLTKWMNRIDQVLTPILPAVLEIGEAKCNSAYLDTLAKDVVLREYDWSDLEYKFVRNPFTRSGEYSANTKRYWGEDVHLVGGVHSRVLFRRLSLDKDVEVKRHLLDLGWKPKEWNTNNEGIKTSPKLSKDDPFEGVEGGIGRLVVKRVQCKHRRATLEGWQERIRPDGRLPSRVTGLAATGRATHSEIVNVPGVDAFFGKWMRKCFTCDNDKVLVSCDAGSCQDRMLANRARNQEFTDMLLNGDKEKGTDGHSLAMKAVNAALELFGLPFINRGRAKNYNFGWKFGASDNKLGQMAGGSKDVGAAIRQELKNVFPAQAELVDRLTEEWRSNAKTKINRWNKTEYYDGWITGLDGRPIFIPSEHAILVYTLQSDEAICMAAAYNILYNRLIKKGYRWGVEWAYVCWYHDEYTIECKPELAEDIKLEAEQAIVDAGRHFNLNHCPQVGEAEIGINWFEIH